MSQLAIETHGLTRSFGKLRAVDHVDLQVPAGSIYGYLGRNGAGKTTTIQMMMGLLDKDAGEIRLLGLDPYRQGVAMKQVVSYVPERVQLYDWMKVSELVWFVKNLHRQWDDALAADLLRRFDLPPDRRLGQLSRGMQGKAALTVALASRPRLLLLDDPTSGLDALVRREFMAGIVDIVQATGVTVFFSSHLIDDVERVSDWIGILHEGRLIVQCPLDDLKQSVHRVIATFPDSAPVLDAPSILQQSAEGRQRELIWKDFTESDAARLRAAGATDVQVQACSLEDIFIAHVRTRPARAEEVMAE
jgi:ABC-2 type transport system ATP-binding protein